LDQFIAKLNIEHLRKQIAEEPNDDKRRILSGVLAREEATLALIVAERRKRTKTV